MSKKIILFADGTGNAFSTQESNIWRLFDALDTSKNDQIALYIEGVGTSSFRPWAMIDGATGIGAPANVRKLYHYLCWNWDPDDEIYMFGFSRGAFTIRTLIELIKSEGLVPRKFDDGDVSHEEMERNAMAAWRAYREKSVSWQDIVPILGRLLRNFLLFVWPGNWGNRRYAAPRWVPGKQAAKLEPVVDATRAQKRDGKHIEIKFVGLFDTVQAFGVPLEALRSAIDKMIWPISYPIEEMSEKVWRARHALSLDDERTTFHPIRIKPANVEQKSITERLLATDPVKKILARFHAEGPASAVQRPKASEDPDRIREVWFAGVHSDIGGGYPNGQLAYIPLVWMLEEVLKADREYAERSAREDDKDRPGLRFRPGVEDEFRNAASPFGTLHDSREGQGLLYRYSPRKFATDGDGKMIDDVVVHHTVVKRMLHGSDNYAPVILPPHAEVLRADGGKSSLRDYITPRAKVAAFDTYERNSKRLLDNVWERQANYFVMLGALLLLLFIPMWEGVLEPVNEWLGHLAGAQEGGFASASTIADTLSNWGKSGLNGLGTFFGGITGAIKSVTPSYLAPYLDSLHAYPYVVLPLIILIWGLYSRGNKLRDVIRDQARDIWKPSDGVAPRITKDAVTIDSVPTQIAPPIRGVSHWWEKLVGFMRSVTDKLQKKFNPASFASRLAVVAVFVLLSVVVSRVWFNLKLGGGYVCDGSNSKNLQWLGSDKSLSVPDGIEPFATNKSCWASGLGVEKGVAYRLRIDVNLDDPWLDRAIMTDVGGFENDGFLRKFFKGPFLRWPSAGWLQPIARIGETGDVEWPLVANDGSGPADGSGCKHLPKSYLDTPEFCKAHDKEFPCASERTAMKNAMGWSLPLPSSELERDKKEWLKKAWKENRGEWRISGYLMAQCPSSYPRTTLVSDFVAKKTGELFLFVNDALPWILYPTDAYANNRGSAKVTLQRVPLSEPQKRD